MCKAPFMQWYPSDFAAKTRRLTLLQKGAYRELLDIIWMEGAPLPDDDDQIARSLGITKSVWLKSVRSAVEAFFDVSDGTWRNKRLEEEWGKVEARRTVARDNGSKGGRPKADPVAAELEQEPFQPQLELVHDATARTIDQDFDAIWPQFPKLVGKGAARLAYAAARKKAAAETIAGGVLRFSAETMGKESRYIAHPASWLNGERWLDQQMRQPNGGSDGPNTPQSNHPRSRGLASLANCAAILAAEHRDRNRSVV